ncbi:MAG TPA: metal ABC transporter permease, partial [Phycisphaeraceae bacterium]
MLETLAQLQIDWSLWDLPLSAQWRAETLCSMLVGTACGVLGCFVVLRRMALIGDALSHAVLPGVVIAFMLSGSAEVTGLLLGALFAGLTTAVLINLVSRFSRTKEDSAIGIVFTALFALGIILISGLPRGTHFDLKCFLFGDPLAVGEADLWMMAVICPAVVGVVALLYHRLKLVSFDPVVAAAMGISVAAYHYLLMGLLSATVVAGLKTTGVILVVAMVITPASAAYQLTNRFWLMLTLAGAFGAASALAGMALAFMTNSPTGPAMVVVAMILFMLAVALSPTHGVVF